MQTSGPSAADWNKTLYDSFWENVPDYPRYHPGARHRRRILLQHLAGLRCATLLDVGCGDGLLLRFIRQARPDIGSLSGADLAPDQVDRNRTRMPDMTFFVLDIEKGGLERKFDVVVCSEVVEHVADQRAAIGHLASMVEEGGVLLVTCPTGRVFPTEKHFGHVHHPTAIELGEHAHASGMAVLSVSNWGWPTYSLLKWATNVNHDWALKHFASRPYSAAAKAVSHGLYWLNYLNRSDDAQGVQLIAAFRKVPGRSS